MTTAFPLVGLRGPLRKGLLGALLDPRRRAADPSLEAYVVGAVTGPEPRGLMRAIQSVVIDRFDLVGRLDRIAVPTLFLTGDNPLWTVEQAREQVAWVPAGELRHLPGVRHLPMLEEPEEVAALLRQFWGRPGEIAPGDLA